MKNKLQILVFFTILLTIIMAAYASIDSIIGTSPGNNTWTSDTTPTFFFNVSGNESSYTCELHVKDSTGWSGYGVNTSVENITLTSITANTTLEENHLNWYINCTNATASSVSGVYNLSVDNTLPTVNIMVDQLPSNTTWLPSSTPNMIFNLTDNLDSNINYTLYANAAVFNSSILANNTPYTIALQLVNGSNSVYIQASDEANAGVGVAYKTYMVDTELPTPVINLPLNGTITLDTTPDITFNITEGFSTGIINYTIYVNEVSKNKSYVANHTETTITLETLTEGVYTIVLEAMDNATNRQNTTPLTLFVDSTVPVVNLMTDQSVANNTWLPSGSPQLVFNVTDNLNSTLNYSVYVDGSVFNTTAVNNNTPVTINFVLTNGSHSIYVEAFDGVNYANSSFMTVKVDTEAPTPVINSPVNDTWTTDTTPTISFNVTEGFSTVNYTIYIDSVRKNRTSILNNTETTITLETLTAGEHSIVLEAMDNASNAQNTTPLTINIDPVPPAVNLMLDQSVANNTWQTANTPNLMFNVTDNLGDPLNYTVFVDGSLFNTSSVSNKTIVNVTLILNNGSHTVYVEVFDEALTHTNSSFMTVKVDTELPTTTDNEAGGWHTADYDITLTPFDSNSSINFTSYRINGGTWANGTTVSITTEGNNTVDYYSVDDAGNVEATNTIYAALDKTDPEVSTLNTPSNNLNTNESYVEFNFSSYDNLDSVLGYKLYLNQVINETGVTLANGTTVSTNFTLYNIPSGLYNWTIEVTDDAGNSKNYTSYLYFVSDTVAPSTTDDESGLWHTADYDITLTPTDAHSTINYTSYRLNGGAWANGTTVSISTEGNNTVNFYSVDDAGNVEATNTIYAALDKTAPVVSALNGPANGSSVDSSLYAVFNFSSYDNLDTVLDYKLYLTNVINETGTTTANGTTVSSNFTLRLQENTNYTWKVEVTDDAGLAANYSGVYTLIVPNYPPSTSPTVIQANINDADSDGNIELTWAADTAATYYRVYRNTSAITDATGLTALITTTATAFEDNTTVNGSTYWYAVTSLNANLGENKSIVSDSFNATANDTIAPRLTADLNASSETNGAVTLTWLPVTADVSGNVDTPITYRIFRTTNVSALNTSVSTENIANTTSLTYSDTTMTTATNYSYVVTSADEAFNHNSSISLTNNVSIVPSACSNSYTYGAWSACASNTQSRTGTRTCYGGGNTSITESQSCSSGTSSSSTSSRSTTTTDTPADTPAAVHNWAQVAQGTENKMKINNVQIPVLEVEFKVKETTNNAQISIKKLNEKPADTKEHKRKTYRYLEFNKYNLDESIIDKKIKIKFKVENSWLSSEGINEDDVVLVRYVTDWAELSTKKLSKDDNYTYYEAETPGFSFFAIAEKEQPEEPEVIVEPEPEPEPEPEVVEVVEDEVVPEEVVEESNNNIILAIVAVVAFLMAVVLFVMRLRKREDSSLNELYKKLDDLDKGKSGETPKPKKITEEKPKPAPKKAVKKPVKPKKIKKK